MDAQTRRQFDRLRSVDGGIRFKAFQTMLRLSEQRVSWVYEVWDDLVARLDDPNSYQRSITVMLLCNLAKSDDEHRLRRSIGRILDHTQDEKFTTFRQCIQSLWKPAVAQPGVRERILRHLQKRFGECVNEQHFNLIRQDIIQSLRRLHDTQPDEQAWRLGKALIGSEANSQYRKQYESILGT